MADNTTLGIAIASPSDNDQLRLNLHVLAQYRDNEEYVNKIFENESSTINKQSMLTWRNSKGETTLHIAARNGRLGIVQALIKHAKALLNNDQNLEMMRATDQNGDTALHMAARKRHTEVVKLLLVEDRDSLFLSNKMSETPLHLAVESGGDMVDSILTTCRDCTKKLLEHMQADESRWTLLAARIFNFTASAKQLRLDPKKRVDTHLIIATLIATVTFAAGFTLPGGYNGDEGPNKGMAVLARRTAFKAFVLSDIIAVMSSTIAVFLHLAASMYEDKDKVFSSYFSALVLIVIATISMSVAFITGLYTVLTPSLEFAISMCFFGSFCTLILYLVLCRFILNRITRRGGRVNYIP